MRIAIGCESNRNACHTCYTSVEVPKANYASSITSSIGSSPNKHRKIPPPAAAAGANQASLGRSLLSLPPPVQRPTTKSVMRTARANKVLVTLWLMSASAFRRLSRMEDALKAVEEAERVDASSPDVWYQVHIQPPFLFFYFFFFECCACVNEVKWTILLTPLRFTLV